MEDKVEYVVDNTEDEATIQNNQLNILKYYGADNQLDKLIQECAELVVAITKFRESGGQRLSIKKDKPTKELNNLISEMADVENLIEQIKLDYDLVDDGVRRIKKYKVDRELGRINKRNK